MHLIVDTIVAYRTDLSKWEYLGVALPEASRSPGTVFRPCVVYNARTALFIMWFEDRGDGLSNYQVATSSTPQGPFTVRSGGSGQMPGSGKIGDFTIFVDDDARAYHVRTGSPSHPGHDIVLLDDSYTRPVRLVANFTTPGRAEGPTMFKRHGTYYVTAGSTCCACIGGSSVYVLSAPAPQGPWTFQGDVGSNPTPFDPHSPHNFVTNAQGSAVFEAGSEFIYVGNQWNSGLAESPLGPRHHDLLYFGQLEFSTDNGAAAPRVLQMVWHDQIALELPEFDIDRANAVRNATAAL